jgi:hypothetical protein
VELRGHPGVAKLEPKMVEKRRKQLMNNFMPDFGVACPPPSRRTILHRLEDLTDSF